VTKDSRPRYGKHQATPVISDKKICIESCAAKAAAPSQLDPNEQAGRQGDENGAAVPSAGFFTSTLCAVAAMLTLARWR